MPFVEYFDSEIVLEMMKKLGNPSDEDLKAMKYNYHCTRFNFIKFSRRNFNLVFII